MKKKFKKTCARVLALTMALSMAFSAAPANSADAKAKKPVLSKKKVTITVKKTQKVRIKNTKGIKKTTWSVKNKKIAKLTKKKKTSVVIKGVKKGSTTVTAKVKTKKKTYKLKLKVTVKKALPVPQPTAQVTANPGVIVTPAAPDQSTRPLPGQSAAPAPGETTPPSTAPSQTPVPTGTPDPDDTVLAIAVPGERTGIKQGESLQLNATGNGIDQVKWSVSNVTGVSISESGLLTVAADTEAGRTVKVTVTSAADSTLTDSVSFKIIENQTPVLTENQIQMNQSSEGQPYGLNYRSEMPFLLYQIRSAEMWFDLIHLSDIKMTCWHICL